MQTKTSPIVFKAIENNVVIDERNSTTPDGINIENASWIEIDGFEVIDQPRAGIRAAVSDFVTIKNNNCQTIIVGESLQDLLTILQLKIIPVLTAKMNTEFMFQTAAIDQSLEIIIHSIIMAAEFI